MTQQHKLTLFIKRTAYKISPTLGRLYEGNTKFFNDGIVGFVIGIPISFLLYQPFAGHLKFTFLGVDLSFLPQLAWYITAAFISFAIQHFLRRKWVFQ